jgi:ElaB/YqjD/DUF883 family membrane-anchored ribosome-binding protein
MATTTEPARQSDVDAGTENMTAVQKLREQADAVVQRIQPQIAAVSTYARNEPTKALLISAATGAALMGLIALMVRSGNRSSVPASVSSAGSSAFAAIREAALDLADSAQDMVADAMDRVRGRAADAADDARGRANDAIDDARGRAQDAADRGRSRAGSAMDAARSRAADAVDSVSDSVADAWKKVRDQAAPVVDKVRPRVEAAASYVKDDPARAAIGLAAAGALIAGLVALARSAGSDDDDTLPY